MIRIIKAMVDNVFLPLTGGTLTDFLTLHAAPTSDLHAATKKYVDDNTTGTAPFRFSANKGGTPQASIATITWTKLTFGTEDFDDGGYYDIATSRFTPPADRAFEIHAKHTFTAGVGDGEQVRIAIYKNGAAHKVHYGASSSTTAQTVSVSATLKGNGTDYYEVYAYFSGAGGKTVSGDASLTYFEARSH